jgi:2-polyprenyl-3-methyl-5-hydroxy-6-metoxy-1,4-benzoquinol methylase
MVTNDPKAFFYERFADRFDREMNMYDLERRIEIVFDEMLPARLDGKELLDAGCGTGWFSQKASERGASVTSMDVGENLLKQVAGKCDSRRVVGDVLSLPFDPASFDIVVCTEVIEHTVEPSRAVRELSRVLRPGGELVLTVPNRVWHFAIDIANLLKLRPYEGYENWVSAGELRRYVEEAGLRLDRIRGFHLFPFVLPATYGLLKRIDRYGDRLGPIMLNLGIHATKL